MRRKEITFDLTPLLDVILILFFSVLLLNVEQIAGYMTRLFEVEEERLIAEMERDEALAEFHEASMRLEALREWDDERLEVFDALEVQTVWRAAIENVIFVVAINIQTEDDRRIIIITRADSSDRIELIWAVDGRNVILNEGFVSGEVTRFLSDILHTLSYEWPVLILFNEAGVALQEFNLIYQNIGQFTRANPEFTIRLSIYTHY